jgi:hypothetical protein
VNESFEISDSSESSYLDIVSHYSDAEIEMLLKNSFKQFHLPENDQDHSPIKPEQLFETHPESDQKV